jgi:hypothetical protein
MGILSKVGFEEEVRARAFSVLSHKEGELEQREDFYEHTFIIIDRLRRSVEADGAQFLVVILPTENLYQGAGLWGQEEKITKLIDFLEKKEIKYFNSAELLASARQKYIGECFTFSCRQGHFNELGHEVFAKILYGVITPMFPFGL